jgi:hypothetical protein
VVAAATSSRFRAPIFAVHSKQVRLYFPVFCHEKTGSRVRANVRNFSAFFVASDPGIKTPADEQGRAAIALIRD